MFKTKMTACGRDIELKSEFLGDEAWFRDSSNRNRNRITVAIDGDTEEFYVWGSPVQPKFDSDASLKTAFCDCIIDEGLLVVQGEEEDALDGLSEREAKAVLDGLTEAARKLQNLGLDEDAMIEIANAISNR